jgi:hypothetical protein
MPGARPLPEGSSAHLLKDGRIAILGDNGIVLAAVSLELLDPVIGIAEMQRRIREDERNRISVRVASATSAKDDMRHRLFWLVSKYGGVDKASLLENGLELYEFGANLLLEVAYDISQRPRCPLCDERMIFWQADEHGTRYCARHFGEDGLTPADTDSVSP